MFLSNPLKILIVSCLCVFLLDGCGSSTADGGHDVSLAGDTKGKFPFSTQEPREYQGDVFITNGGSVEHCYLARKGDKWRIDYFAGNQMSRSAMRNDQLYSLDHRQKIYSVDTRDAVTGP